MPRFFCVIGDVAFYQNTTSPSLIKGVLLNMALPITGKIRTVSGSYKFKENISINHLYRL